MKNYITIFTIGESKIEKFLMVRSKCKGLSQQHDGTVHLAVDDHFGGVKVFEVSNTFNEIERFMNRVE